MRRASKDVVTRGSLVEFMYSSHVRIYNIRLKDSPSWTVHIYDCDDVHIRECHVEAPLHSPNTDGWDPDSSRNVLIEDSTYIGGDDCVAIKSGWDCFGIDYGKPSVNITLRNLTCSGSFAGGIALGSEMSGGIENVLGEFLHFPGYVNKPINIKTSNTRGGYVRNVTFRDIDVTGILQQPAIHIDMLIYSNNGSQNPSCPANWTPPALPIIEDLFFYRMNGTTAVFEGNETYHIMAFDQSPISNMVMEDVYFPSPSKEQHGVEWLCSALKGTIKNHSVSPWPPCAGFDIVDDGNVSPSGIDASNKQAYLLRSYMELYGKGDCFFACSISCCAAAVLLAVVLAIRSRTWNRKG
jgi:Glycosyl hydrolases family 28